MFTFLRTLASKLWEPVVGLEGETQSYDSQGSDSPHSALQAIQGITKTSSSTLCLSDFIYQWDKNDPKIWEFIAGLIKTDTKLTCLDLSLSKLKIRALDDALRTNATLERLILDSCDLSDSAVQTIASILQNHPSLRSLSLRENRITALGAGSIAVALEQNHTLTELILAGNTIADHGASALAKSLRQSLRILHLSENRITALGAHALAECLQENRPSERLVLHTNTINYQGITAIVTALKTNTSLHTLSIGATRTDNCREVLKVAEAIADMLMDNHTLRVLLVNGNRLGAAGTEIIAKALIKNEHLQELNLDWNCINPEGAKALLDSLLINTTLQKLEIAGWQGTSKPTINLGQQIEGQLMKNRNQQQSLRSLCAITMLKTPHNRSPHPLPSKRLEYRS